jgi:competence protein ComEC
MHVAVLGTLVFALCRLMLFSPRRIALVAMAVVVLYGMVALPSPPVWRSVILCASVAAGMMLCRAIDFVQLLALSTIALLVHHPLDLYGAGFQLSFGTVLGLIVLTRRLQPVLTHDADAAVAMRTPGGHPPLRIRLRYRARQWLGPPLAAGLIAWLVSMPLIAFHFDQLNPWAVVASLLLAIPVFCALIAGFFKIVLTLLLPFGAHWWAAAAALPVSWMRHSVDWLATLPFSDYPLPAHSILFVIVYYALLLLPMLPANVPKLRFAYRLGPALAVLLLIAIPLAGGASALHDGALRVTALAIGAGQCCVIELPDGRIILLDAGSMTLQDPVRKCIQPYLRSRGYATIDEIWLADCDYDHVGAAAELIASYGVGRAVISSAFEEHARSKPSAEALLSTLRQHGVQLKVLTRGDRVDVGKGATIDVLWPQSAVTAGASNNSDLVLKLSYARRIILFPADIQQPAQAQLLKDPSQLHCDAMLAPHHGSGEATTGNFIAAADPLYIVSSNDRTLSQKQRTFEKQIGNRALFRTSRCGATTITVDGTGGITVTPYLAAQAAQ